MPNLHANPQLLEQLYESALEPGLWTGFLQSFGRSLDAEHVGLFARNFSTRRLILHETVGYDPVWQDRFRVHYAWTERSGKPFKGIPAHKVGVVPLTPDRRTSEFFNDWMKPQGLGHTLMGLVGRIEGEQLILTAQRPRGLKDFGEKHRAQYNALAPHIQRALRLRARMARLSSQAHSLHAAFEHSPAPTLLLDGQGKVVYLNAAARTALSAPGGLRIEAARLTAALPAEAQALQRLLAQTRQFPLGAGSGGGSLALHGLQGQGSVTVTACPVSPGVPQRSGGEPRAVTVVFLSSRPDTAVWSVPALMRRFGLTAAEARLSLGVLEGKSVATLAEDGQIAQSTVRRHLHHIFSKTGVRRQGELVSRLLRAVPGTPHDPDGP